jgi:hypothetical protein
MSSTIDQRLITVVNAIKQAIQSGTSPGLSVNTHPNPFFVHVIGEIDLKRAAEIALERLDAFDERVRAEAAKVAWAEAQRPQNPAANDAQFGPAI